MTNLWIHIQLYRLIGIYVSIIYSNIRSNPISHNTTMLHVAQWLDCSLVHSITCGHICRIYKTTTVTTYHACHPKFLTYHRYRKTDKSKFENKYRGIDTDYKHAETEMKDHKDKSKYAANFKSHIRIKTAKKSREIKIQSKISYQRNWSKGIGSDPYQCTLYLLLKNWVLRRALISSVLLGLCCSQQK